MRADNWKRLLKEKGWMQGSRIVVPNGSLLDMHSGEQNITISPNASVTSADTFVVDETGKGNSGRGTRYFLWEDLTMVGIRP